MASKDVLGKMLKGIGLESGADEEYDEEYIFSYEDGTKITISII